MNRPKLIIVEGPQGAGKTTVTNFLREKIVGSNLYRLSGHKDTSMEGLSKSTKMYDALMTYIGEIAESGMNLIFDRIFITEHIYGLLGYKDYDTYDLFDSNMRRLEKLASDYDIIIFNLYVGNSMQFSDRLGRDKPGFPCSPFEIDNSMRQQEEYKSVVKEIKSIYRNISVYDINTCIPWYKNEILDLIGV